MPKHLISFGSSCYFPAALLLLLPLDLQKCPPVTITQRGIVLPSLAASGQGCAQGKSWGPCNPHLKGPLQTSPLLVCLVTAWPTSP